MRLLVACLLLSSLPALALAADARRVSPEAAGNAMDPVWSPDGATLVYEVAHPQEKYTELFMLRVESGTTELVTPPAGAGGLGGRFGDRRQVNHEFSWSPTGQLYAFSSSGTDDEFDVWLKGVTVPIGTEEKEGGAVFSADGRHLAYCSAATGDGDLYLLDIYALEDPPTRLTTGTGLDFYATWAPEGPTLAYTAMSESGTNIHVIGDVQRAAETERAITRWPSTQLKPSFSPDGRWLAFFSNHDNEDRTQFDIYAVQVAGGEPFKVAADVIPSERRGPVWTPDSNGLIAVRNDPNQGDPLIRVDIGAGTARIIQTGTVNNAEPAIFGRLDSSTWSVAFVSQGVRGSDEQAWRRVWVVDIQASSRRGR